MELVYSSAAILNFCIFFVLLDGKSLLISPVSGYLIFSIHNILTVQFTCAALMLITAVDQLMQIFNNELANQLCEQNFKEFSRKIKQFSKVYTKICETCQNFSEYFSILNIFTMFPTFFFLCTSQYALYVFAMDPTTINMILIIFALSWTILFSAFFLVLVYISCKIDIKSRRTLEIVQERMNLRSKQKEFKRFFILTQQISHQRAVIACGSFTLNLPFLFDLYAVVMSSTVVFIQFYGFKRLTECIECNM